MGFLLLYSAIVQPLTFTFYVIVLFYQYMFAFRADLFVKGIALIQLITT